LVEVVASEASEAITGVVSKSRRALLERGC
jgi:hypothetical protein